MVSAYKKAQRIESLTRREFGLESIVRIVLQKSKEEQYLTLKDSDVKPFVSKSGLNSG